MLMMFLGLLLQQFAARYVTGTRVSMVARVWGRASITTDYFSSLQPSAGAREAGVDLPVIGKLVSWSVYHIYTLESWLTTPRLWNDLPDSLRLIEPSPT